MNTFVKIVGWIMVAGFALVGLATTARFWIGWNFNFPGGPHELTYSDFLTVTLTALCALLTALAIFLAIAAYVGYKDLRKALIVESKQSARQAVLDAIQEKEALFQGMATKASFNVAVTEKARQAMEESAAQLRKQIQSEPPPLANPNNQEDDKPKKRSRITQSDKPRGG